MFTLSAPFSSEHGRPRGRLGRLIILHAFKLIFVKVFSIYLAEKPSFVLGKGRRRRKKTVVEVPQGFW